MEGESAPAAAASSMLQQRSRSFRLRSPSLNTLRLRRVFDIFDQDSDGLITASELSRALDRLGLGADPAEVAHTVSSFIRRDREGLEFEDFEALHAELGNCFFGGIEEDADMEEEDADMEEAFRVFDEDGDGYISAVELHTVLAKLGMEVSMGKVKDMIFSVDSNCDGRVDFGEFKTMMTKSCTETEDNSTPLLSEAATGSPPYSEVHARSSGGLSEDEIEKMVKEAELQS